MLRPLAILLALVLDVLAIVSIWRSLAHGRRAKIFWTTAVLILPIAGAIGWYTLGREKKR